MEERRTDNQGNPIDGDGKLIVEKISGIDELTDGDFTVPYRSVVLPRIPDNVDRAIGDFGQRGTYKKQHPSNRHF